MPDTVLGNVQIREDLNDSFFFDKYLEYLDNAVLFWNVVCTNILVWRSLPLAKNGGSGTDATLVLSVSP